MFFLKEKMELKVAKEGIREIYKEFDMPDGWIDECRTISELKDLSIKLAELIDDEKIDRFRLKRVETEWDVKWSVQKFYKNGRNKWVNLKTVKIKD